MARSFNSSSGKKTFGVFSEPQDAGDYIYNKKARASYCVANNCIPAVNIGSQGNLLLFNRSNKLSVYPCKNVISKNNLNINLITKMNLNNVPVISYLSNGETPVTAVSVTSSNCCTSTPYLTYNIDPCGNLFGNNVCGINNYLNYLEFNPPSVYNLPYIINGSYSISSDSNYNTIITFTTSNANILFTEDLSVNYIVVGGGGGGGGGGQTPGGVGGAGGGGGGAVLTGNFSPTLFIFYVVTIGEGGSGGSTAPTNGLAGTFSSIVSTVSTITANGGLGGQLSDSPSTNGTGGNSGAGGSGGLGQALTPDNGGSGTNGGGGGGGGSSNDNYGGNGATSTTVVYSYSNSFGAGGGGGVSFFAADGGSGGNTYAGTGGGGLGQPTNGGSATPNYGGGGGGGSGGDETLYTNGTGGNGGSGIVILYFNI